MIAESLMIQKLETVHGQTYQRRFVSVGANNTSLRNSIEHRRMRWLDQKGVQIVLLEDLASHLARVRTQSLETVFVDRGAFFLQPRISFTRTP